MKLAIFKIGVFIVICAQIFAVFMILQPKKKTAKTRTKKVVYQYKKPIDLANDKNLSNGKRNYYNYLETNTEN
jgi:uncharacterized protein YpmB